MSCCIEIRYCTKCHWLLRSTWMAQELLSTFEQEISELVLIPDSSGGVFEIRIDGKLLWSREKNGGFPEIKQLKILVRDSISPQKDLGHIER